MAKFRESVCSKILKGCEWGKIEITGTFVQEGEKNMRVIEIHNRLRSQQSTRAEAALKWEFFDETPDRNCMLRDVKRKDDEVLNRKGR